MEELLYCTIPYCYYTGTGTGSYTGVDLPIIASGVFIVEAVGVFFLMVCGAAEKR
jgi:hypothetical protein